MRIRHFAIFVFFLSAFQALSQEEKLEEINIEGQIMKALITDSDTLILASLHDVSIISPQFFKSKEEYHYFLLTRKRAAKVYPYAVEAIKVFREIEEFSQDSKKRQTKKYVKKLQKDLKEKFQQPLRDLSRTQGQVLVEMIERETGFSTFQIIKDIKGGFKAVYWNNAGKFFGYRLKKGYFPEEDPILEMVLKTFDISFDQAFNKPTN